jgi:hypothetical protein
MSKTKRYLKIKIKQEGVSFYMKIEQTPAPNSFSWDRERTVEEITDFISRKLAKFEVISNELELVLNES